MVSKARSRRPGGTSSASQRFAVLEPREDEILDRHVIGQLYRGGSSFPGANRRPGEVHRERVLEKRGNRG